MFGIMKHSNILLFYGISFSLCCFVIITNTQRDCPSPDVPADGRYTPERNKFLPADKVHYTCKDRFILVGENSRTCLSNGTWSNRTPFCDRSVKLVPNMLSTHLISRIADDNVTTCFASEKSTEFYIQLHLHEKAIVHAIKIFLNAGTTSIRISAGMGNKMHPCVAFNKRIEKRQWIPIKCDEVLADTIGIRNIADRPVIITICEIQVYVKDENSCEDPPDIRVANGYFEVSRNKATLICEYGYKSENARIVCEGKSWKNVGSRCDENLCEGAVSNSTSTVEGEWKFLDYVSKTSAGTRKELTCNAGYQLTGGPVVSTCQKNGKWTKTNAMCIKEKPKTSTQIIIIVIASVVSFIILVMLGFAIYLIMKQRREVVVVYNSTDGRLVPESEYSAPYYETMLPIVPTTPRPRFSPALSEDYSLPEDCKGTAERRPTPSDIAFGTLKQSTIYGD